MNILDIKTHKENLDNLGYTKLDITELMGEDFKNSFRNSLYQDDMMEMANQFNTIRFDLTSPIHPDKMQEIVEKHNLLVRINDFKNINFSEETKLFKYQTNFAYNKPQNKKLDNSEIEDIQNFIDLITSQTPIDNISQIWLYSRGPEYNNEFSSIDLIWKQIYDLFYSNEYPENTVSRSLIEKTRYSKNCYLEPHEDGQGNGNIFGIIVYLNNRYNKSDGGYLTFGEGDSAMEIEPIFGNIAVIDFSKNDPRHAVEKVTEGDGRFAYISFIKSTIKGKI